MKNDEVLLGRTSKYFRHEQPAILIEGDPRAERARHGDQ